MKVYNNIYKKGLKIDGRVYIRQQRKSAIRIGCNFKMNSRFSSNLVGITNYAVFQCIGAGKIEIGDNCGFTSVILSSRTGIYIGDNIKIGGNVRVFDHDYHSVNHLDRRNKNLDGNNCKTKSVIVENDVFIGTNSIILKGVHIGARSIIGAGSVVSIQNIPPDSLVIGNPARIISRI